MFSQLTRLNASFIVFQVDRNYESVPTDDPRWNDLHVVSSLLKSYFRKIPDSLVTNVLYSSFIKADKIEDLEMRMKELRRLVKTLPPHNYQCLKHLVFHLRKVVDHCDVNKMEAKNLAIVFGPNIVRSEEDLETMVNNMTHQCKIVETFLTCVSYSLFLALKSLLFSLKRFNQRFLKKMESFLILFF